MAESINHRFHSEDTRQEVADLRARQAQPTTPSEPVQPAPASTTSAQSRAEGALPEIDRLRAASRDLASTWTGIVAASDGSIEAPPETDWSAWETAERGQVVEPAATMSKPGLEPTVPTTKDPEASPPTAVSAPSTAVVSLPAANPAPSAFSQRDRQLLENPELTQVRARFEAHQQSIPRTFGYIEHGDGGYYGEIAPSEAERQAHAAAFVDAQTGISSADLAHLDQSVASENQRLEVERLRAQEQERRVLAGERFATAGYGLNERDRQVAAHPELAAVQARFEAFRRENTTQGIIGYSGESEIPQYGAIEPTAEALGAFVDPQSGISGRDLMHLQRSQSEQAQGDAAMKKLAGLKVGSFTGNAVAQSTEAARAFTVIGQDQREAMMAGGHSLLGKAILLNDTGQLLLPDEHETGVYFLSNATVEQLKAAGVIDLGNGGLNIDGLYLDSGNAHIGTSRPKGGLFGNFLNHLGDLLPGGKLGELAADAISDVNSFVNEPLRQTLSALGEDQDDFATQVIGHQTASVDVMAHAGEHGNRTYDVLVQRTAEFAEVDQVANQIGQAMVASGIPIVNAIGAGITVVSGSMMAGHAQLQGDAEADPNQGITQAATSLLLSQASTGISNATGAAPAGSGIGSAEGAARTFASGTANSALTQAVTSGEVDLDAALVAGALGVAGAALPRIETGALSMSAVQAAQLAEAVREGDAGRIASLTTGALTEAARDRARQQPPPGASSDAGAEGTFTAALSNDAAASAAQEAAETPAPGPQSAGEAEAPEPQEAPVQRTPDALDRARLSEGSTATVGPRGTTLITRPDGTMSLVMANGVVLETNPESTVLDVRGGTFGQAFAAARESGVGVFNWQGQLYNTGTADEVAAVVRDFAQRNAAVLSSLAPEARQAALDRASLAVTDAFSQNAMRIASHQLDNLRGLDPATLRSGLDAALTTGAWTQAGMDAQRALPGPEVPAGADSLAPQFSEGEFSALNQNPLQTADALPGREFGTESPEVTSIINARNLSLGNLPAASTVKSWEAAADQIDRIRARYPDLTPQEFDSALRSAYYSNSLGERNQFPIWDPLLGSGQGSAEFVAAVRDIKNHLPQEFPGPDGRPLDMSHAWVGLDAMNQGHPGRALLLTHLGDYGQALGQLLTNGLESNLAGARTYLESGSLSQALQASWQALRNAPSPMGWAPDSQLDANTMGFTLSQLRNYTPSIAEAMRLLAQGMSTPGTPQVSPEENNSLP